MIGLAENGEMFGRMLARLKVWLKNCGWAIGTTDELVLIGWLVRNRGSMPPNEALLTWANDGAAKPRATTSPASHFRLRIASPFSPRGDPSVRRGWDATKAAEDSKRAERVKGGICSLCLPFRARFVAPHVMRRHE